MRPAATLLLLLLLGACSGVSNPAPVATYDGLYVGSRRSNDPQACGVEAAMGRTSATVSKGRMRLDLFSPATKMEGTVGEDGTIRASGLWLAPHSFIAITVLNGKVVANSLTGTASNSRCVTEISLIQQPPPRRPRPERDRPR